MAKERASLAKRLTLTTLAVLFAVWALGEVLRLIAGMWWQLLAVAIIVAGIYGGIVWWKWRRNRWR